MHRYAILRLALHYLDLLNRFDYSYLNSHLNPRVRTEREVFQYISSKVSTT